MQPKSNIVHLPVYQPGKPIEEVQKELGLTEVIKLASNENPFGCSERAKAAIMEQLGQSNIYPDGASAELAEELASRLGVQRNQLVFGTGSSDIILMICRAFLAAGDETVMADETFSQYKHNAEIENARIIEVPLSDGKHDLDGMLAQITDRTKIVWICNPNNPTGTIVSREELAAFLDRVPAHVLVVLDEAYFEFAVDPDYPNGIELLEQYGNLVVLRTFSKAYGLAAFRIGYGVGRPEVIRYINQVREPFNTSRAAQAAAKAALQDPAFVDYCRSENRKGVEYLYEQFERLCLAYFPTQSNFVLVDAGLSSLSVFDALLRKGVIVRAGWRHYPTYIRVSVGTDEQNRKFVAALEDVLQDMAVRG
ncbi:histidinol-phosphate transaminase [Paenibacillus thailandensis]|uniref:Histidinol-phosphate aminotransferase n=1 Tax=Paenibacillus thailandensis TaxID=393250 RepID=A0ABW5QZV8_9BACL